MLTEQPKITPIDGLDVEANFTFCEFQTKNREMTEECLALSKRILNTLVGPTPEESKKAPTIDCFMSDLLSERETLCELGDTLHNIIRYLEG